jgi:pimeloyl-ACP methyl ester carboxylesterase/DNA-binding SARP family transcriptional activator
MPTPLRLHVFGELRVSRGSEPVALPASRKTRALLAYLALTGRPHRRERLCEIFWDLPDDPRGSLRWSLSKIRPLVNDADQPRVRADRERVALALDEVEIDLLEARQALGPGTPEVPLERLQAIAAALALPLLDGLDLPQLDAYQAWLAAEREDALSLRLAALERIIRHPEMSITESIRWARAWYASDPLSPQAASMLAGALDKLGRTQEADEVMRDYRRLAQAAGLQAVPDLRAFPEAEPEAGKAEATTSRDLLRHQTIGFCTSVDGVRIAYARVGEGPPLVKAANWLNHLELDWASPIWGKTFQALAERRTFIRYDERGNGLSDWDVDEISFECFVRDLEAVVDSLGLERFPLLGMSQGCAVSIAYAVRHPERVSALILIGGYSAGWRIGSTPEERERREAVMTLTRLGWGTNNAAYRHIFSQTFMPDGTPEELAWFDEFQRQTTSPENAVRFQDAFGDIDVQPLLGEVRAPTLVLHARDDQRITLAQGRELAIGIPGARFVPLESRCHVILGHEPAWATCMAEINRFLDAIESITTEPGHRISVA